MKIYLSAPLFSQVERRWNRMLAAGLMKHIQGAQVVLPQDFKFGESFNQATDFPMLFRRCIQELENCDLVVAVLDGPDVDSGTAFEVGYAYARGIPIVGIRTDFRKSQDRGLNLMLSQCCTELLRSMSFNENLEQLVEDLCGKITIALRRIDARRSPRTQTARRHKPPQRPPAT
jgi:nucleoside 2-deoxyribosyltransferase